MKIIRPFAVTDAALTFSNVLEILPDAYSSATTYGLGDVVAIVTGTVATIYESLQDANTDKPPALSPAWWRKLSQTFAPYDAAVTYGKGDRVTDAVNHHVYESIAAGNLGNALSDATKWTFVSSTNRWAMFDATNSTQTTRANEIDVTIAVTGKANGIGVMNVNADTIRIVATTALDGTVHDETYSLVSTSGINDWYSYFTEEINQITDFVRFDLPSFINPSVRIVASSSGTVAIGSLIVGSVRDIGATIYGARSGIQDYSRVEENAFGEWTLIRRNFAKRASFKVWTNAADGDFISQLLASYRATPIIWAGTEQYASTWIYGFYKDFAREFTSPDKDYFTLEIQGLT